MHAVLLSQRTDFYTFVPGSVEFLSFYCATTDTYLCCVSVSRLCHPAPSNNVIMQELKEKNVKILSEKVLLLLNRGGKKTPYFPFFTSYFTFTLYITAHCLSSALQTTLCVCSNTPRLHHTQCSSFCRMFLLAGRRPTSSTALTWWWWSTSLSGKYLTFHLEIRWDGDTLHNCHSLALSPVKSTTS